MSLAEIELGRIHFLEEATRFPLCRRNAERSIWNWTLEPSAVSCPACRALLPCCHEGCDQGDEAAPGLAASGSLRGATLLTHG